MDRMSHVSTEAGLLGYGLVKHKIAAPITHYEGGSNCNRIGFFTEFREKLL
jgi:hypothetical protein